MEIGEDAVEKVEFISDNDTAPVHFLWATTKRRFAFN